MGTLPRAFLRQFTVDDYPWGAECTVDQLLGFFQNPSDWLTLNVNKKCFLPNEFVLRVRKSKVSPPQKGYYQLMGNNYTNFVMLYVTDTAVVAFEKLLKGMASGDKSVSSFMVNQGFTREGAQAALNVMTLGSAAVMDIQIVMEKGANEGRVHCHFPITQTRPDNGKDKLLAVASFVHSLIKDKDALCNICKNSTIRNKNYIDPEGNNITPTPTHSISFNDFTTPDAVGIEYICDQGNNLIACEMLIALYNAGVITVEEAYIKDYS